MSAPPTSRRPHRWLPLALLAVVATACTAEPRDSITAPASPQAAEIDGLWTFSLVLGTLVWIVVMVLLAIPVIRSRRGGPHAGDDAAPTGDHAEQDDASGRPTSDVEHDHTPGPPGDVSPGVELDGPLVTADTADTHAAQLDHRARSRLLWIGGIIGPALILVTLLVVSGRVGASVAHVENEGELVIEVHGHMFWWEVHYPEEDITTANEIHVPVDRPVRLRLTTEDVIHSFWIPRVHGKVDMIPGTENWLSFEATETGRFRGQCAEFCGIAHAQMVAFLEVQEPDDYDAWVANQQQDAAEPQEASAVEGQRVFIEAGCAACHAVSGTDAIATVGPDLTHLASRGSLAAGIVPNTRENLAALILDPWDVKPGNPMPPTRLDDDELDALLDYLEVLE